MTDKQILIRVPEQLAKDIQHDCIDTNQTMTSLVNRLLEEYLIKRKKQKAKS